MHYAVRRKVYIDAMRTKIAVFPHPVYKKWMVQTEAEEFTLEVHHQQWLPKIFVDQTLPYFDIQIDKKHVNILNASKRT